MALQKDGKIIVSGLFPWQYKGATVSNIFRLNADGSLDQSFNVGQGPNSVVNISLIQPDGKIVAFGYFSLWGGNPASRVVRLNTDGSLDTSFTPGSGFDNSILTAALTPDNKIYAGGYFGSFNGVPVPHLTRLDPNGTQDATFNPILPGTLNPVSSLVVRSDGKVTVKGSWERSEEHTSELQSPDHLVCRLLLEKKNTYRCILRQGRCIVHGGVVC